MIAPVVYLAGQVLLSQRQALGPDPLWFLSHTLLLCGTALFVPALFTMAQYPGETGRILASLGGALAVCGALTLLGQFTIDLAVGRIASNQAEMTLAFQHIQADRGMNLVFYILAPASFFIGELMLVLLLAFARLIPRWTGWIAAIGFTGIGLAVATNNVIVFLLGFAGLALGPMRVGWQTLRSLSWRKSPGADPC